MPEPLGASDNDEKTNLVQSKVSITVNWDLIGKQHSYLVHHIDFGTTYHASMQLIESTKWVQNVNRNARTLC